MYLRKSRWMADGNGNPKTYNNKKTWFHHRKKMMLTNAAVLFTHIDDSGKGKETETKHSIY
jgi:hypothetical protein